MPIADLFGEGYFAPRLLSHGNQPIPLAVFVKSEMMPMHMGGVHVWLPVRGNKGVQSPNQGQWCGAHDLRRKRALTRNFPFKASDGSFKPGFASPRLFPFV